MDYDPGGLHQYDFCTLNLTNVLFELLVHPYSAHCSMMVLCGFYLKMIFIIIYGPQLIMNFIFIAKDTQQ